MADEIENQNVIQIYRSPADGLWRAHIGPDDGRGVEQLGGTPCQALGRLIQKIHGGQYAFDPSWYPLLETGTITGMSPDVSAGDVWQPIDPIQARLVRKPFGPPQGADPFELAPRATRGA